MAGSGGQPTRTRRWQPGPLRSSSQTASAALPSCCSCWHADGGPGSSSSGVGISRSSSNSCLRATGPQISSAWAQPTPPSQLSCCVSGQDSKTMRRAPQALQRYSRVSGWRRQLEVSVAAQWEHCRASSAPARLRSRTCGAAAWGSRHESRTGCCSVSPSRFRQLRTRTPPRGAQQHASWAAGCSVQASRCTPASRGGQPPQPAWLTIHGRPCPSPVGPAHSSSCTARMRCTAWLASLGRAASCWCVTCRSWRSTWRPLKSGCRPPCPPCLLCPGWWWGRCERGRRCVARCVAGCRCAWARWEAPAACSRQGPTQHGRRHAPALRPPRRQIGARRRVAAACWGTAACCLCKAGAGWVSAGWVPASRHKSDNSQCRHKWQCTALS